MDDFDREVRERLDVPLHSPFSLTPKLIFYGLVCLALMWFFDASSWVLPFSGGLFGYALIKWLWARHQVKKTFHMLAKKAHLAHPDIHLNEVLLGTLAAWKSQGLPPVRVFFPSDTKSKWIFEDGRSPPAE